MLGIDQGLRLMFLVDGTCWGAAGMVRTGADFTDRETDYLAAVAPALATATRLRGAVGGRAIRRAAAPLSWSSGPAVRCAPPPRLRRSGGSGWTTSRRAGSR